MGVKIETQLSKHLWSVFYKKWKYYFIGIPKEFWPLRDKRFFNYGRFKGPKRGNFGVFWVKIEIQLFKHVWSAFFTKSGSNIFWGIPKKFWALRNKSGFWIMAILKGQKGVILWFFLSKLKLSFLGMFGQFFYKYWK